MTSAASCTGPGDPGTQSACLNAIKQSWAPKMWSQQSRKHAMTTPVFSIISTPQSHLYFSLFQLSAPTNTVENQKLFLFTSRLTENNKPSRPIFSIGEKNQWTLFQVMVLQIKAVNDPWPINKNNSTYTYKCFNREFWDNSVSCRAGCLGF